MLTDTKVRNLKPKDKLYRMADSHGLALEINPKTSTLRRQPLDALGGFNP
jgi:hypothetical protein